jgi:hypothetical protein
MARMQKLMPEYVETVYVMDPERPKRSLKCFQLVKEYVKGDAEMLEIQYKTMNLTISPVLQVYHVILASGDRGITTSELMAALPFMGIKVLGVLLSMLLGETRNGAKTGSPVYISMVPENVGTSRINRYYPKECTAAEVQRQDMKLIGFELPEFIQALEGSYQDQTQDATSTQYSAVNAPFTSEITPVSSLAPTPLGSPTLAAQTLDSMLNCKHCKNPLDVNITDQDYSMEFCSKKCQDLFYVAEEELESKTPNSNRRQTVTATALQRRRYLKELLEINNFMVDYGRNIASKVREYGLSKNDQTIGKHKLDIKTMDRTIDSMKSANELKVICISFENFGGRSITKKILCSPSASVNGPEFKAFVHSLREDNMLAKTPNLEKKVVEVADTIQRFLPKEDTPRPKLSLGDMPFGNDGKVICENYGYLFPKNLRMIALHGWLFDCTTPDWSTPIKERYVWNMLDTTAKMPLSIFLKCFGVRSKCPSLDRLLSDPQFDKNTPISELPADVKAAVINMNLFKDSFFTLVSMLEVLELIVPLQKDQIGVYKSLPVVTKRSQLPAYYRIARRVPSYDFTVYPPIKEQIIFNSNTDITSFWRKMEITYENMSRNTLIPKDFLFLSRKKLWKLKRKFTKSQITILAALIDPKSKATPVENEEVCKALAEELELSFKAVQYFYNNYNTYDPTSITRRRKRKNSDWYGDTSDDDDSDASVEDFEFLAARLGEQSGSEDEYMESRGSPFSSEDDNLLCLAAVVLNHFKSSKKPIHVLTQLFPIRDISKVTYRRRITYLKNKSGPKMTIDTLSAFWPEFLSYEKSKQSWLAGISDALLSSNFLGVVHAFRKFVSSKDP